MEFIGHGALGILGLAPAWARYFAVVGIGGGTASALMPLVGTMDVCLSLMLLLRPARAISFWMVAWALWTALLRPLAHESVWETVERAGNYGAPLALFILGGPLGAGFRIGSGAEKALETARLKACAWTLRLTTALLLFGHGALNLWVAKPVFAAQYAFVGLRGAWAEPAVGAAECALALWVLARPSPRLLVSVLAWKVATEALFPLSGSPVWVFIEHGGSYAAPLALALLQARTLPGGALVEKERDLGAGAVHALDQDALHVRRL